MCHTIRILYPCPTPFHAIYIPNHDHIWLIPCTSPSRPSTCPSSTLSTYPAPVCPFCPSRHPRSTPAYRAAYESTYHALCAQNKAEMRIAARTERNLFLAGDAEALFRGAVVGRLGAVEEMAVWGVGRADARRVVDGMAGVALRSIIPASLSSVMAFSDEARRIREWRVRIEEMIKGRKVKGREAEVQAVLTLLQRTPAPTAREKAKELAVDKRREERSRRALPSASMLGRPGLPYPPPQQGCGGGKTSTTTRLRKWFSSGADTTENKTLLFTTADAALLRIEQDQRNTLAEETWAEQIGPGPLGEHPRDRLEDPNAELEPESRFVDGTGRGRRRLRRVEKLPPRLDGFDFGAERWVVESAGAATGGRVDSADMED